MAKGDKCTINDCINLVRSGNICQAHNWRMKVYGSYDKPNRKRYGGTCRVESCNNPRDEKQRSSLCIMHRVRMSRHKSTELPEKKKMSEGIVKICNIHGELKKHEVYKVKNRNWSQCRYCNSIRYEKARDNRPIGYKQVRNYIHLGKPGNYIKVSIKDYKNMLISQNYLCKICNKPESMVSPHSKQGTKNLAIDHCHVTKKIRGLLCHRCNTGIGGFYESIELLQSAIDYLKSHQ